MNVNEILETAQRLEEIKNQITEEKKKLLSMESEIDRKQEDILHYIELNKWNAVQGMRLLKALKVCRQSRRDIKNRLTQISSLDCAINGKTTKQTIKHCETLETRTTYKTKVVKDVFDMSQYEIKV